MQAPAPHTRSQPKHGSSAPHAPQGRSCPTAGPSQPPSRVSLLARRIPGGWLCTRAAPKQPQHHLSPPRRVPLGSGRVKVPTKTGRCLPVPRLLRFHFPFQPACPAARSLAPRTHAWLPGSTPHSTGGDGRAKHRGAAGSSEEP